MKKLGEFLKQASGRRDDENQLRSFIRAEVKEQGLSCHELYAKGLTPGELMEINDERGPIRESTLRKLAPLLGLCYLDFLLIEGIIAEKDVREYHRRQAAIAPPASP